MVLMECYEERDQINHASLEPVSDESDYEDENSEVVSPQNRVITLPSASGGFPARNP